MAGEAKGWKDAAEGLEPLLVDGPVLTEHIYNDLRAAFDGVVAAETLGFGCRLDSYMCPTGEPDSGEEQREYRVLVWRNLTATRGPFAMKQEAADQ